MNSTFRIALLSAVTLFACGGQVASIDGYDADEITSDDAALSTGGKFEVFTGRDGQFYFHLLAANGEKVLASEGYSSRAAAVAAIASVKTNAVSEARYLMREASDGQSYFVVTAANGAIIAVSEMYATTSNATRAAATVRTIVAVTVAQGDAVLGDTRFETFKGLDNKYYFHVRANNGQIVLRSQAYSTKASATAATASVLSNGAQASKYVVKAAADGKFYFVLKAANGQVIGVGETYASKSNAERAVSAIVELLAAKK